MNSKVKVTAGALSALLMCGAITPAMAASISKDETVYATLSPDGTVTSQTVSDWLHSDHGLTNFGDVSNLQDITNVKGKELPQQNGNKLTWNVQGNDVYYQGTSTGTLPVEAKITYTLDGKPVDAAALKGASGHLVIHISMKNNETKTVTVDGKSYTICRPYFTAVGTDLSADHFKNVKAEHGKVQTDSNNQFVAFLAMPGMKSTYEALLGGDLDQVTKLMLDDVEIACDMTDGELPAIYFACASELNDLETKDLQLDEFDQLDELKDATEQLIDGAKQLADGCGTLDQKLGELSSQYVTFHDGIIDATSGAGMLDNGAKQLSSGMRTLTLGAGKLADGVGQLNDGAGKLADGASKVDSGANSLKAGAGDVNAGAGDLSNGLNTLDKNSEKLSKGARDLAQGLNQLGAALGSEDVQALFAGSSKMKSSLKELSGGMNQVMAAVNSGKVDEALNGLDSISAGASKLESSLSALSDHSGVSLSESEKAALASIEGGTDIIAKFETNRQTVDQMAAACGKLAGAASQISSGAESVKSGVGSAMSNLSGNLSKIDSGLETAADRYAQMDAGLQKLAGTLGTSVEQLQEGAVQLDSGVAQYTQGVGSAASGASKLAAGTKTLYGGAAKLADGTGELASGAQKLSGGLGELNGQVPELTKGAGKLADGADQLAGGSKELSAGMKQLSSASGLVQDAIHKFDEAGSKLSDGSGKLYDGIIKYNEEGISKITDNKTLTNLRTAAKLLDEQRAYAQEATCYSGAPESATETSTKYVMRTEEVQNVEKDDTEEEAPKQETFWDRVKGLF